MKQLTCDRCGVEINHNNKVLLYNYTIRMKKKAAYPKRDDFDLCDKCRKGLMIWFEFKNPVVKK